MGSEPSEQSTLAIIHVPVREGYFPVTGATLNHRKSHVQSPDGINTIFQQISFSTLSDQPAKLKKKKNIHFSLFRSDHRR